MAEKILMLALSPTMTEGTIAAWKVKEGEAVSSGTVLCEVETDKAVMDYESAVSGTLLKIVRPAGDSAAVGDLIAVVGKEGEDVSALIQGATLSSAATQPAVAQSAEPVPAASSAASTLQGAQSPAVPSRPVASVAAPVQGTSPFFAVGVPPSSPLARSMAKASGLDIRSVVGSGPGGRVVKRDVQAILSGAATPLAIPGPGPSSSALARPTDALLGGAGGLVDRVVPVSRMRATIARRLSDSMREAPHFFLRSAMEMDRLITLRESLNRGVSPEDKISFNTLFAKLASLAMRDHPVINASWLGDSIVYHGRVDVGLAVALPEGLIVPVVRDCVGKGLRAIEGEFRSLIAKARSGALQPADYEAPTFTISNLGSYGVEEFTAIINPPGSAILALGRIAKEAVVAEDGTIVARSMMRATLSCDHRVIDGAEGASFMKELSDYVEEPALALL